MLIKITKGIFKGFTFEVSYIDAEDNITVVLSSGKRLIFIDGEYICLGG